MTIIAIIVTLVVGIFGTVLAHDIINFPGLGTLLAIAAMGGFVMAEIKKQGKK